MAQVAKKAKHATLETTKVSELLPAKKHSVVTLEHNQTLKEALKVLQKHGILSAPILLAPSVEDQESGTYMGVLDILDILKFVVESVAKAAKDKTGLDRWMALKDSGLAVLDKKMIQVCGTDTGFGFPNYLNRSVMDLIKDGFVQNEGMPAHRIAISNEHGHFTHIVTQSDVVRFIASHPSVISSLLPKTAEELGLCTRKVGNVVTVPVNTPAVDAFETMFKEGVSSVGLVDDAGRLVGNLSASDLRGMDSEDFPLLMKPAAEFVKLEKGKLGLNPKALRTVHPTSRLGEILDVFKSSRVHRLYVVDDNIKPVGIVTLTDILSTIVVSKEL